MNQDPAPSNEPANPPQPQPGRTPAQPSNQPGQTVAGLSAQDVQAEVQRQLAARQQAEQQRMETLSNLAEQTGLGAEWVNDHIRRQSTVEQAQSDALSQLASNQGPIAGLGGRVSVGDDGRESLCAGLQDAILLRCGVNLYEELSTGQPKPAAGGGYVERAPHERALEMEDLSLIEIGRAYLHQLGVSDAYRSRPEDVARLCLDKFELASHIGSRR